MISALQLAVKFKPKRIILHGCDIGEIGGVRYFDNTVPPNDVNVTEDGLEYDGPGPSKWGPDINFDTFGDSRNG